jgi:hypothetical protein
MDYQQAISMQSNVFFIGPTKITEQRVAACSWKKHELYFWQAIE